MTGLGLKPDVITMNSVIEALDEYGQVDRAMDYLDEASSLFDHVWVSESMVDLHECSAAVARTVMRCLLRDLKYDRRSLCDITVVTGRGKGSEGEAVLPLEVRSFLSSIAGPTPTEVPTNPGRFILKHRALREWIEQ